MTRSRIEADREDLMAEAVNLRERVELRLPGQTELFYVGCNPAGHWSFYFGPDQMIRLDGAGLVRRAFFGGRLYRTQGATLAELTRVRQDNVTNLERRDLTVEEVRAFLEPMESQLRGLRESLVEGTAVTERSVGLEAGFTDRLLAVLTVAAAGLSLAPAIPTKRS